MSNLLAPLDLSYLGKPSEERLALDKLGPFSSRVVTKVDYSNKKFKLFTVQYNGVNGNYLTVDYKEQGGQVTVLNIVEKIK